MNHNPYSVGEQPTFGDVGLKGPKFEASVRTMQIIAAALMIGVLSFLFVVLMITKGDVLRLNNPSMITLIAAGFGFLMIVNHFIVPGVISNQQIGNSVAGGWKDTDEESRHQQALAIFQTQLIVGLALLEGAAFFNLIALMIGNSGFSLGVVVLLLSLMLLKFPTQTKVSWWVQDKVREMSL